jgi:hypothetical protein
VGNESERLLAPNRITRRAGVLLFDLLFKTSFASGLACRFGSRTIITARRSDNSAAPESCHRPGSQT